MSKRPTKSIRGRAVPMSKSDYQYRKPMNTEENIKLEIFSWAQGSKKNWITVGHTANILPSGVYKISMNDDGSFSYTEKDIKTDDLLTFKNSQCDILLNEIDNFWKYEADFKKRGYLQRNGYLLYGPPGSGKTAITEQITSTFVKNDGIAFICDVDPEEFSDGLQWFRRYEPERRILCLFEDIDSIITRYGDSSLLSCLDGENQISRVINVATTNYPENLDKRIINRPRRFSRIIKVGFPSSDIRESYFINKLKISKSEVKKWVDASDNFSFAACADLVIYVKCLHYSFDDSVKIITDTLTHKASSSEFKTED